jgi:hypothetical protein
MRDAVCRVCHAARARTYRLRKATGMTDLEWKALLERHGNQCFYCKAPFTDHLRPTIDHIVPTSRDGARTAENVVPACALCNSSKCNRAWVPRLDGGGAARRDWFDLTRPTGRDGP